ncbi:MAG: response regulator [Planctomycetes bacterium]|nr:response regulator [Planctomycetota bacterium]
MPHVLIADNDRAVSSLLGEVLVRLGFSVAYAYDGEQALAMARDPAVGALVCDLDMPRASGVEVLEALRDLPAPPATIVVSGYLDAGIEQRLGCLPFVRGQLRKPFDLLGFARQVAELAGAPQGRDTARTAAAS